MSKLRIRLDTNKCVGESICTEVSPERFEMRGKKAFLLGSTNDNGFLTIDIEVDEKDQRNLIDAAVGCPTNAIDITDISSNKKLYDPRVKEEGNEIKAEYDDRKEFVLDPKGYFLIRVNYEKGQIEVGHCKKSNKINVKIIGEKPIEIYQTIIKHNLITRKDHAAYLGRELQKAYIALQQKIKYVQDDELDFMQKVE